MEICSCNVLMLTNEGYYRQKDGLVMGRPPAPLLANGWISKFDKIIQGDAKIYFRYMDDISIHITQPHKVTPVGSLLHHVIIP